jgi:hypothetical protein
MKARAPKTAVSLMAGLLVAASCALPAAPERLSGSISGWVTDSLGVPQMGATVLLFNDSDRIISRVLTDETGGFLFDSLRPDVYSIKVVLASFFPALKQNIKVQPGMKSLLSVNLAGVLSSIELVYSSRSDHAIMSDEWKWVLRTSSSTRPVLRILPRIDITDIGTDHHSTAAAFSETRGLVKLSAGDQGRVSAYGNEPDLGTAFALATSLFGNNQLQVSGNVAYAAASGMPAAGFRTRYSRTLSNGSTPEVRLTMRQLFLPARAGTSLITGQEGAPALRTMSVGFQDETQVSDLLHLDYGFSLESVSFLQRLNYFSPFARLTYKLGDTEAIEFGYTSGLPPAELVSSAREPGINTGLQQDLAALALFPRVSLRDGRARVQRVENFEISYRKSIGSRTYSLAAYTESTTNAALTLVAPAGFPSSDLLPDLLSHSSVFNIGDYSNLGYMLSVSQALGDYLKVIASYGSGSALTPVRQDLRSDDPAELRGNMEHSRRHWASMALSGSAPRAGTQFVTSYRWADGRSLTPSHIYITQALQPDIGLNVYIRQPVPAFSGLPWKLEACADFRNLMAEGYIPLYTPEGRHLFLMHTPRSVRGGLNFIF